MNKLFLIWRYRKLVVGFLEMVVAFYEAAKDHVITDQEKDILKAKVIRLIEG